MQKITEIKRHKNKPEQRFLCELALREPGHIAIVYHAESAGRIADIEIAPGSTTIAHYWQGGGYVLWRMFSADKRLIGTLFHICANTDIQQAAVSYDDLILDIWISPRGEARVLDEDELSEAAQAGLVTAEELRWIDSQRKRVLSEYPSIIENVKGMEAGIFKSRSF